jgi:hypothetical protein
MKVQRRITSTWFRLPVAMAHASPSSEKLGVAAKVATDLDARSET